MRRVSGVPGQEMLSNVKYIPFSGSISFSSPFNMIYNLTLLYVHLTQHSTLECFLLLKLFDRYLFLIRGAECVLICLSIR